MTDKELKEKYMQALSRCIIQMGECTDDIDMIILQNVREVILDAIVELEQKEKDNGLI